MVQTDSFGRFHRALWSDFQSQQAPQTVLLFPKHANKHRYRWKKPDVERFSQATPHQCSHFTPFPISHPPSFFVGTYPSYQRRCASSAAYSKTKGACRKTHPLFPPFDGCKPTLAPV